ncbi:MAG: MOSC domain-containing protein [Candidatus Obscuribacterales bacterium]|nr:MOSC domain-containing protein [Candidatus Obscuribacterales bacterium]
MTDPKLTVSSLHYYPVKSCAGIDIDAAQIVDRGIKDDRGWLVVDDDGKFITQREIAKMALIKATVVGGDHERGLHLEGPGMPSLVVLESAALTDDDDRCKCRVTVWNDTCTAVDQGHPASEWLSRFLETPAHLVRMYEQEVRKVRSESESATPSQVSFQDGFPLLVISTASLADLNSRLEEALPMNRFRPNIVVDGAQPFEEDQWLSIRIGDIVFEMDSPCSRCVITTIDQSLAVAGKEPLKTLASFRREGKQVMFGQNAIHLNNGTIKINDTVEILKRRG